MTTLLTLRDNIKGFLGRYDYIVTPLCRFVLCLLLLTSVNGRMGYMSLLENGLLVFVAALVCAFLPIEVMTVLGGIFLVLHSLQVSLDVGIACGAVVIIFYCSYMRYLSKTGIIVFLIPLLYMCHLTYAIPILLGCTMGFASVVPMAFGVVLQYYEDELGNLTNVLATATQDEDVIAGYSYITNALVSNKLLLLTILAFAVVIFVTYLLYRLPFAYSWIVGIITGGILNIVIFLLGGVQMNVDVAIGPILLESVMGMLLSLLWQFMRGIVDYQRTELLQFEDDEYYYYVKAIPKLSVSELNKNVKHINSKTHK